MIYIDSAYNCHSEDDGTRRAFEVPYFDGKCPAYIEGHIYVPEGEEWTREDGMTFFGEMITPWVDYRELMVYQAQYLKEQLADADGALEVLYGDKN